MTDNLYAPPQSDLSKPSGSPEPYTGGFDRPMIIASILLSLTSLLFAVWLWVSDSDDFDLVNEVVSIVIDTVVIFIMVYFIKRLRVYGLGSESESVATEIGVWGYFWRGFVVQNAAMVIIIIPLVLFVFLVDYDSTMLLESLMGTIILGLALLPISIFCVWAFFSNDRSGQLNSLLSSFRGR